MIRRSDTYFDLRHEYDPLDDAPDYPELDPYPPSGVSLDAHLFAATMERPLRFVFQSGDMPDFPSVAPGQCLCSARLRTIFERTKAPDDVIHWAPAVLNRRSDGRDFMYWCLLFPSAVDVLYYSWYDRLRARLAERRLGIDNALPLFARVPYVLDSRKLEGRRVFSFGSISSLYAHRSVVDILKAERITNMRFVKARVHQ
jgi:hypothetical protein